ncbi:hypothetical protein [Aliikangiella coralliicola]|uniref:Baseplate protein J-like domain-containing protein n=1 Tax=Aliikangiella coralliicola TaxID=2592383 RepID=A0A545UE65_9GAMM|nr:hypothetical protein [Aliikangiella coralliicola]TQV87759.1 hypothetical protein FLL46_10255 [Aliikangiella coralliicola]
MTCPCDDSNFPQKFAIHAGLKDIPRALGIFPDWRLALLDAIGRQPTLNHWRARGEADFGVMLVEMSAYLLDVISFYDSLIANDSYLTTSRLTGTERKLVSLLGYLPRPALASQVWIAAEAQGRRLVELPAKTAFRSGEYDGNPPEVFELEKTKWLDPRLNKLAVSRVQDDNIPGSYLNSVLVAPNSLRVRKGSIVVLSFNGVLRARYVTGLKTIAQRSRRPTVEISFSSAVPVPANSKYSQLRIFAMGNSMPLWRRSNPFSGVNVLLDSRAPIRTGQFVVFEKQGSLKVRKVNSSNISSQTVLPAVTTTVKNTSDEVTATLESPEVKTSISQLQLSSGLSWSSSDRNKITMYFSVSDAARVLIPEKDELQQTDPVHLRSFIDEARVPVTNLLLEDTHQEGVYSTGSLNADTQLASIDSDPAWNKSLMAPVNLFGNVFKGSRGESVEDELLGVGDASMDEQVFELKNSPLTYVPAENEQGYKTTLTIYVGGVQWFEVASFFGVKDDEPVYLVRHDEMGKTLIHFGGGARLPSGAPVYANYRFGAGSPVPPAGSINQVAKPISGLQSVKNVLPAFGGGDAESPQDLKHYAPNSALLLGRAVSLADLEAAAHEVSGVEAVKGIFRWDKLKFEKRAVIYFIGDSQLKSSILSRLQALSEPEAAIEVKLALPQTTSLELDLEIHSRYQSDDVIAAVQSVLYRQSEPSLPGGLLHRTVLGPEGVIYHSQIMEAVMEVAGVSNIKAMTLNGSAITGYGIAPAAEHYFYFGELGTGTSGITINGVS